jgi:hypothetical protein
MTRTPDLHLTYSADKGSNCGQNCGQTVATREIVAPNSGTGTSTRHGWVEANRARRKHGRKKAIAMLALKISRHSGQDIAALFGTTRGAVYQRLFRLRTGRYS